MPLLPFQFDLIMCSITALLGLDQSTETHRDAVIHASSKQHHRGPDWSGVVTGIHEDGYDAPQDS